MADDFGTQEFEIITDESGQELVKLLFMDENNESSGYALLTPEDAKKIMNGEATLQNVIDEEGKQVLTLVSTTQDAVVVQDTSALPETTQSDSLLHQPFKAISPASETAANVEKISVDNSAIISASKNLDGAESVPEGTTLPATEDSEHFTISEQAALIDGHPVQMISILDSTGNIIDQKHGHTGAQVVMEIHGQAFAYEIRGPTESGEPITSTLLLAVGNLEDENAAEVPDATVVNTTPHPQWPANEEVESTDEDLPAGQHYTLTEATTIVDGKPTQTVVLGDDKGNVVDQKQGNTGEHVTIELSGQSLDYVFMGPSENNEPIQTVLVVTQEDTSREESEAAVTAADWCPTGLSPNLYTSLRRHAEAIVNERLSNRPELSFSSAISEPYQRKLGSYSVYQEMVEIAKSYAIGASQGETLERYDVLRGHAKIYRSGPQARPLTVREMVINEVASQICRYKPGLLFHKRELYQLAQSVAEACSDDIKAVEAGYQPQQHNQQSHLPLTQQQSESTAVSGQVANSQLAMLESRGLTAIQPNHAPVSSAVVMTQVGTTVTAANLVPFTPEGGVVLAYTAKDITSDHAAFVGQHITGKQEISSNSLQHYLPNMSIVKRDLTYKLTASETEALRLAAVNALTDMPASLDVKPKSDCTNIERASWDRAMELVALRSESAIGTTDPHSVANLLVNDGTRVDSVREIAALYGRAPIQSGGGQVTNLLNSAYSGSATRSSPVLTPYETACNEAAAYLAAVQPALLTRRRELVEQARKVVRNSGCQFTHAPNLDRGFYAVDQVMELDLSAAEQLLHDPLERLDLNDEYTRMSDDDDCISLDLTCEDHNILDDVAIYVSTGTDTLKKVRILNLPDCSFTGIMPFHLNQCVYLVELNLSNNCLHAFPRCLYLPNLRRLNISKNPFLVRSANEDGPPLVEQFARLTSLELDAELKEMLKPQSLAYLCPHLSVINEEDFKIEVSEKTTKTAQMAKQELATLIHSKWEDDLVEFFKKSVPHRDLIRVIETLVSHAVNQSLAVDEPFRHCKSVLARRIAEEFLAPKVVDEEDEDEHAASGEFFFHSDADTAEATVNTTTPISAVASISDGSAAAATTTTTTDDTSVKTFDIPGDPSEALDGKTKERRKAAEAEREAVAAAHNMTLLPDEPLDRLSGIIGTAMQHGKTVVYSVIRTAARQPNGDLIIPVVSGSMVNADDSSKQPNESPEMSDSENNVPPPTQTPKASAHRRTTVGGTRPVPSGGAVLGSRRPGLMVVGRNSAPATKRATPVVRRRIDQQDDYNLAELPMQEVGYGDLDEQEETQAEKPVKIPGHWEPGKRGRPPTAHSQKRALAEQEEQETAAILQNVKIPPPHAPPPATLRMSTRDSNRMKRFSAYGAIDTAAALAGRQEALIAAAFAQADDETEVDNVVSTHQDVEMEKIEELPQAIEESEGVLRSDAVEETPIVADPSPPKKTKKPSSTPRATKSKAPDPQPATQTPVASTSAEIEIAETLPQGNFDDDKVVQELIEISVKTDSVPTVPSLRQLGEVVDYDPLHFIRCHARDNDPLDCCTKVWRCVFEPNPLQPTCTTSVVATCGGECVCLIDCQTGKVLKRFKHVGEEFYAVAWTTVEMATGHQTNLLAAAGKLKEIRLLHPEQLVCYAEMKGHKEEIACMVFHPNRPTILFSGDSKAFVNVWDIGVPSAPEYRTQHHLLMRLVCPRAHLNPVLNLIFMPTYDTLIAGCEDGIFSWNIYDFKKQKSSEERLPTMEIKVPTRREPCFDGLARLSENLVVVKCVEEGELYVIDFSQILLKRKRSASAMKVASAEVFGQLRWQTTDEIYISVTARPGLGVVVCGDNEGTIWLYDLQENVISGTGGKKFKVKPVKILEWPECSVGGNREEDPQVKESINSGFKNPVVNATDISSDGTFLVAVTDNNLVCIWNFSG